MTILLPALAMVLLTAIVWGWAYVERIREMRVRRIRPQTLATRAEAGAQLRDSAASADNFSNLFETPVLFYLASVLLYVTGLTDQFYLVMAWLFVIFRYAHSFIHVTYNRVFHRFLAYIASTLVLWILWVRFGWQVFERAWSHGV